MIISRLRGGLGNQLFQYAAGRAVAHRHGTELKLDTSAFNDERSRRYALDHFRISATVLTSEERERLGVASAPKDRLERIRERFLGRAKLPVVRENTYEFDAAFLNAPNACCLDGYWQSPKYFSEIEQRIRQECVVRDPLSGKNLEVSARIDGCLSVSLHVRRGDYVAQASTNRYHGTCSSEYYAAAEAILLDRLGEIRLFVFSDDPDWAESNLRFASTVCIVRHNAPQKDYEDLRLMSLCKHHIIANSTFSWWGAWLSAHPEKLVVAPSNWFQEAKISASDLVPQSWIRI